MVTPQDGSAGAACQPLFQEQSCKMPNPPCLRLRLVTLKAEDLNQSAVSCVQCGPAVVLYGTNAFLSLYKIGLSAPYVAHVCPSSNHFRQT